MQHIRPGYLENRYSMMYKCINCRRDVVIYIQKGVIALKHSSLPCKYCGCKTLYKK